MRFIDPRNPKVVYMGDTNHFLGLMMKEKVTPQVIKAMPAGSFMRKAPEELAKQWAPLYRQMLEGVRK